MEAIHIYAQKHAFAGDPKFSVNPKIGRLKKEKTSTEVLLLRFLMLSAVRGGFEPPVRLPVRQFSKLLVSATHPSHQSAETPVIKRECKDINNFND